MPKMKESPCQRMDRVFRATVQYGLAINGQDMNDLVRMAPKSKSTIYKRMRTVRDCTFEEGLFYIQKFFNARQLCEMFGLEYHGSTLE